jgi:CheY-like chemotaxis protein
MLAGYTTQAGVPALPARGPQLFTLRHGGGWSCAPCQGAVPTRTGKHGSTGKSIAPLAPDFSPERFTDAAKTETLGLVIPLTLSGYAERELRAHPYEVAVLDLGLQRKDGLDVLAAIRRAGTATPVMVLTVRDAVPDRMRGLNAGADDYVLKSVDLHALAARTASRRNA